MSDEHGIPVKDNDNGGLRLRYFFYNSGGWKSNGTERVVGYGGADSMLQFWLERGGDETKRC
jgi:hypothetical protein